MDTLGLDEAGRGPVLGPLVVAGIVIPEKKEKIIERMGVKDSKRLTPNRRTVLYRKLTKMFDYDIVVITAKDIDTLRAKGVNLNQIEKLAMKKIINNLRADRIIIDAKSIVGVMGLDLGRDLMVHCYGKNEKMGQFLEDHQIAGK